MSCKLKIRVVACLSLLSSVAVVAQRDSSWRISPYHINIQIGEDRRLQLLDDNAQELHGATWTVDNPDLAEIREEDGSIAVHPKAVGTVQVIATLNGEMRTRDIVIWSPVRRMPQGTTHWGTEPIGREIEDLPAVPTAEGPNIYSLEQTPHGDSYLRAFADDGIQVWTWLIFTNHRGHRVTQRYRHRPAKSFRLSQSELRLLVQLQLNYGESYIDLRTKAAAVGRSG